MWFISLLALATYASAAPAGSASTSVAVPKPTATAESSHASSSTASTAAIPSPTVAYASDDPNGSYWSQYQSGTPEPIIGSAGANILGPQNIPLERESPDFMAPPTTDAGSVENVKWSFSLSHNRVQDGGWARQQNGKYTRTRHADCDGHGRCKHAS
ncbi:hypothetical protein BN14_07559 [Rhizoctonia solani AG-1 IB]|uniref:Uncharacterized protein n=1 Tax=Thanatephorus cucumeris (strain AG1-IB / isolate 7/3/14) TaxID=1108050 RepID=M5C230_THACB|nr:hypothetical protein BN14_07559 [Rhizoctonia solani AG-1 IB]